MEMGNSMLFSYGNLTGLLSNPLGFFNIPNFQIYQLSFFTALIFVIIAARITLSVVGRKYSAMRLFLGPIFLFLLVSYNYFDTYIVTISLSLNFAQLFRLEFILIPFLVGFGLVAGHRIAKRDKVFLKKGKPHYRSSIVISLVWAFSFLIKMGVITYLPLLTAEISLVFSAILDITTGLIMGEALKIHGTYKKEYSSVSSTSG